ncbi:kinase-like protein, partial [Saccharata proteae CBS 121410]
MANNKAKQAREAREVQKAIEDRANRLGIAPPPYDFLELIGKGNFGRVFRSKERSTGAIYALKIIEIDEADYQDGHQYREDNIKSFIKETQVLSKLTDSRAKNINHFYAAFSFHSQLWIVSEYCPGGSVRTLMRALPGQSAFNPVGLDEGEVKRIARELAVALEGVHAAGIIHRDIKCANILIREDGQVQLCDFGVAGVLEGEVDKRSTIIGTPHWMPPEMVKDEVGKGYGVEVDMWEYGCTVYEMATGAPPDSRSDMKSLRNRQQAPRLEEHKYSEELRDFVSFCLEPKPRDRPSATDVLRHPFIAGSELDYPTSDLAQMLERYAAWESRGGDRTSLWQGGGAPGLSPLMDPAADAEDWNFSTTVEFDIQF